MNRFLTLILGAVLCGAAPLHAQQDFPSAPDHAAALLQMAQEAAAQGDAQRASEYARAAAELYAAKPRGGDPAVVGAVVRARAAQEQALVAQTHAEAQARAEAAHQVAAARAAERADAAAAAGAFPTIGHAFMREVVPAQGQEPAAPSTRWRRAAEAGDAPPPMAFAMPSDPRTPGHGRAGPAPAPQAPHQDELGMTLRLIHAEVQALRAEVQALRAEMLLMRSQNRSASAAAVHGQRGTRVWTQDEGQDQREVIIVTPDGERRVVIGRRGDGGVWSTAPAAPMLEDLDEEAVLLEDVLEELDDLGYVDSVVAPAREEPSAPTTFRFRAGPEAGAPSAALPVPAVPAAPATPAVPRTPRR